MTLSRLLKSSTFAAAALAAAALTTGMAASGAQAATGPHIQVELAQPVEAQKTIIRGTQVRCADTSCTAAKGSSSAKTMCVKIAREFGKITAFRMGKREFDAAALAKCNGDKVAQAKHSKASELAAR